MNEYTVRLPFCIFNSIDELDVLNCINTVETYNMKRPTIYANIETIKRFNLTKYDDIYKIVMNEKFYDLEIR